MVNPGITVSVEPMLIGDIDEVMAIDRASFVRPWYRDAYFTELANRSAQYFVARLLYKQPDPHGNGKLDCIVGNTGCWVIAGEGHITTLAVHPNYRGNKIGERLLVACLQESIYRRAHTVSLEVRKSNEVAKQLYKKYGFCAVSVRPRYYLDNNEDALVLVLYNLNRAEVRNKLNALISELK